LFRGIVACNRIMLFKDEYADDDNVWQLFLQDGGEKGPQVAQEREGPTKMTPQTQGAAKGHQRAWEGQETPPAI